MGKLFFRIALIFAVGVAVGCTSLLGSFEVTGEAADGGGGSSGTSSGDPSSSFELGGTIRGLRGSGLVLSNGGDSVAIATPSSSDPVQFKFPNKYGANTKYELVASAQPKAPDQTCAVSKGVGSFTKDVTDIEVSCTANGFTIGGKITGLPPAGKVVLTNRDGDDLTIQTTSPGFPSFTFSKPVEAGSPYLVAVKAHPPGRVCAVAKGSGTANANVTNVDVICTCSNNRVLVLGASNPTSTTALVNALTAGGLAPTAVVTATTYANVPPAADFASIVVIVGNEYGVNMDPLGQQAIFSANTTKGVGVVWSEWAAYQVTSGRWTTLAPILLLQRTTASSGALSYAVNTAFAAHPIWAGLPPTFVTAFTMSANMGPLVNGGVQLATYTVGATTGTGVAIKDGPGRIVQNAMVPDYQAGVDVFIGDANSRRLYVNSARWAAHCE